MAGGQGRNRRRNFCSIFQAADAKSLMRATVGRSGGRTAVLPARSSPEDCSEVQWRNHHRRSDRGTKKEEIRHILPCSAHDIRHSKLPRQILNARQTNNRPLLLTRAQTDTIRQRRLARRRGGGGGGGSIIIIGVVHYTARARAHPVARPPVEKETPSNEFPPPPKEHPSNMACMITG